MNDSRQDDNGNESDGKDENTGYHQKPKAEKSDKNLD